ncbi:MAG: winged helix-turn-helix domain-containing protein [Xanthomonadaceae bacterium]|nr:winged helix-turn-helix domain-containing protein [Xanthomonadaceae bacterium]MDE1958107.1 winged helix-turn-helix domain-containing protein [Xanthomonadaceae bacterium]MDE2178026.1 winged helix-turn-helix domain-containing protein [Xanthomonadaceae bacterium]
MTASELTWRQAISKVLSTSATPLHYNEITERIIADKLRTSLGATPAATVNAQISLSIKSDGSQSPTSGWGRGHLFLRNRGHHRRHVLD